jgi:hypothetical protein
MNPSEEWQRMKSYGSPERVSVTSVVTAFESDHHFEKVWGSFSATQWSISVAVILSMILLTYETLSAPMRLLQPVSAGMTSPNVVKARSRSVTAEHSDRVLSRVPSESVSQSATLNSMHTETAIVTISAAEFLLPSGELSHAGAARLRILARRIHQGDLRIEFLSARNNIVSGSVTMAEYLLRSCRVPAETVAFAAIPFRSQPSADSSDADSEPQADNRDSTSTDGDIQLRMTRLIQNEDPESFESISGPVKALR